MRNATLEITTMIGCPLMCTYCPQDSLREAYGDDVKYMSLEDFKTIIDKLPKDTRLDFSGQAEPWVNPACTDMFEYAMEQGFRAAIFTTLYNWDEDTVHRMGDILMKYAKQVEIFKVHFPDEAGNMKGWKLTDEWEYAFVGMSAIVRTAGIHYEAMTMSDHGVHPSIRHLNNVYVSHNWSISAHDRAGTLDKKQIDKQIKEQPIAFSPKHERPVACRKTPYFNQNVLLPNGEILLCCMDYDKKHVLGNLVTQDYDDLFTGPGMQHLLAENALTHYTDSTLCKSCVDARLI
jgi:sulfatase maturation enzyme AslB (radical SAM superfamily)